MHYSGHMSASASAAPYRLSQVRAPQGHPGKMQSYYSAENAQHTKGRPVRLAPTLPAYAGHNALLKAPLSAPADMNSMAALQLRRQQHHNQLPPELRWRRAASYPDSNTLARLELESILGVAGMACSTAAPHAATGNSALVLETLSEQDAMGQTGSSPITIPAPKPRLALHSSYSNLRTAGSSISDQYMDSVDPIVSPESFSPARMMASPVSSKNLNFESSFPGAVSHADATVVADLAELLLRPRSPGKKTGKIASPPMFSGSADYLCIAEEPDSEAECEQERMSAGVDNSALHSSSSCPQLDTTGMSAPVAATKRKQKHHYSWQVRPAPANRGHVKVHSVVHAAPLHITLPMGALEITAIPDSDAEEDSYYSCDDAMDPAALARAPSPETEESARRFQEALSDIKRRSLVAVIPEYCSV